MSKLDKKFKNKVKKLYNDGASSPEIRDACLSLYPSATRDWVYNKVKKEVYRLQGSNGSRPGSKPQPNDSGSYKAGKITGVSKTVSKNKGTVLKFDIDGENAPSDEEILKHFGLSSEEYEVVETSCMLNERYYASLGSYKKFNRCTVKISQKESYKMQKAINELAANKVDYSKVPASKPRKKNIDPEDRNKILEIDLADFHYGLRALSASTGEEYSCKIARETLFNCLHDLVEEVGHERYKKVVFATLGDFIHVDNGKQTTTSGTFQQLDGDIYHVGSEGGKLMIEAIEFIRDNFDTPVVEYIHVQGNHDREIGTMIGNTVEAGFRKDDSVICDVIPNPNKIRTFAGIPVVYCHGDIKNVSELLINQFNKEYIKGTHPTARVHAGHFHSLKVVSRGNIIVKNFPTICGSSIWEHQQGYNSPKALGYTIYNEKTGNISEGYIYPSTKE